MARSDVLVTVDWAESNLDAPKTVFVGFALFAALLNAALGICLGCMIYPLALRIRPGA